MKFFIIVLVVLLILFILFIISGIALNKRNLRKDKHDLLKYFKKHKDRLSITIKEDGIDTLTINSDQKFPLASTLKVLIAFNFVKAVTNKRFSINDKVELDELDKFYLPNTDGDAHPRWKKSINNPADVSLMEVAKGMMQFSSNACTDFLINKIGIDTINNSLDSLQLDSHDQITYLTPPILMPRYLSDKKKIARQQLESMAIHKYQELSKELFEKMTTDGCNDLKENMLKMLDHKTQLAITKKMPSSTTREYADFMYELGGNLLTEKEKDLFSEIVIGKNIKSEEDAYFLVQRRSDHVCFNICFI